MHVCYKQVNLAGKKRIALAINQQIPAPTLHFKEGDFVTIRVFNHLKEETALHWHGVLVPWQMDGVLGVSQKGIKPGCSFTYKFKLMQSGTYWYHAHAGLQEQEGLYGAFIIDPKTPSTYAYDKDFPIVLSDFSNTNADVILANLKKDGDYYSPRFPLQPSLAKFIHDYRKANSLERKQLIADYIAMQHMRMNIYDLSDVAYDAFLLNGHTSKNPWFKTAKPGDRIRLRFIGAAGDSIFKVKVFGSAMELVHVQGNDITPQKIDHFSIAPGETYDVLITAKNKPIIIYAESRDKVGSVYGIIQPNLNSLFYPIIKPFREPKPVTREMMENMMHSH